MMHDRLTTLCVVCTITGKPNHHEPTKRLCLLVMPYMNQGASNVNVGFVHHIFPVTVLPHIMAWVVISLNIHQG